MRNYGNPELRKFHKLISSNRDGICGYCGKEMPLGSLIWHHGKYGWVCKKHHSKHIVTGVNGGTCTFGKDYWKQNDQPKWYERGDY